MRKADNVWVDKHYVCISDKERTWVIKPTAVYLIKDKKIRFPIKDKVLQREIKYLIEVCYQLKADESLKNLKTMVELIDEYFQDPHSF